MMTSMLTLVSSVLLAQPQPVDVCNSAVIQQARAAIDLLHRSPQAGSIPLAAIYEGTLAIEAHMAQPNQVRIEPVRLEFTLDGDRSAIRERSGDQWMSIETMLTVGARAAAQASADAPYRELIGPEAMSAIMDVHHWLPHAAVDAALSVSPSLRTGPVLDWQQRTLIPITYPHQPGPRSSTLLLDDKRRIIRTESLAADQRLGDVCEWTAFQYESPTGAPADVPTQIERFKVVGGVTLKYSLKLVSASHANAPNESFDLPMEHRSDIPAWEVATTPVANTVMLRSVAEGLFVADLPAANARVVVIERAKDLVVLEAPDGDKTCGELLQSLSARFPGKPVGLVAFGHHHPSYTGGLRAFAAQGATIITPRATEPFIRLILSRPTTLGAPAVSAPPAATVVSFEDEYSIEAGDNDIRLIDIGSRSRHTDHYVIFYLPNRSLLFQGDLGYFPTQGAARVNPRLSGLVEAVTKHGLKPARLIQSWPLRGTLPEVPWETVEALVRAQAERAADPARPSSK